MNKMTPLLSVLWPTGWPGSLYSRETKNQLIHKASFSASILAIYSSPVEDRATVACCFDC